MEKCLICDKEFNSIRSLTRHLTQKHRDISIYNYRKDYREDLPMCPYCSENYCLPRGNWYSQGTCGSEVCRSKELSERGTKAREIQLSDPNYKDKLSESLRRKWTDEEFRKKQSESRSNFWNSEQGKALASQKNKERYQNPEFHDAMVQHAKDMNLKFHEDALSDKEVFMKLRAALRDSYITINAGRQSYLYLVQGSDSLKFGITINLEKRVRELGNPGILRAKLMKSEDAAEIEFNLSVRYFEQLKIVNSKSEYLPQTWKDELLTYFDSLK